MNSAYLHIAQALSAAVSRAHEAHERRCEAIGALANQKVQIVHQEATGQVEASKAKLHEDLKAAEVQAQSETDAVTRRIDHEENMALAVTTVRGLQIQVAELRQKYEPNVKAEEPEAEPDEPDEDDLDEEEEDEEDDDSEDESQEEPSWTDHGTHWTRNEDDTYTKVTVPIVTGKSYMVEYCVDVYYQNVKLEPFTGFVGKYILGETEDGSVATAIDADRIRSITEIPEPTVAEEAP